MAVKELKLNVWNPVMPSPPSNKPGMEEGHFVHWNDDWGDQVDGNSWLFYLLPFAITNKIILKTLTMFYSFTEYPHK